MTVVVRLRGGLGNQMFQYVAGLSLAHKNNCKLMLDQTLCLTDPRRPYSLDQWGIKAVGLNPFLIKSRLCFIEVNKFLGNLLPLSKCLGTTYFEKGFGYDSGLYEQKGLTFISGYWQSCRYFKNIEVHLRHSFSFSNESFTGKSTLLSALSEKNSIAVHVRRGDYVSHAEANVKHGVQSLAYYRKAIAIAQAAGGNKVFYFSDDPQWVKERLMRYCHGVVVSGNDSMSDAQEMWLMSRANHHVIANSTFSWWAAWLGKKEGQCVVVPKQWFAHSDEDLTDLICSEWKRV